MAVFAYKALEADTTATRGTVIADTARQARDQLRARGLTIQDLASLEVTQKLKGLRRYLVVARRRAAATLVTTFVRELATLLAVGIPLLEAIDTIGKQHQGHRSSKGRSWGLREFRGNFRGRGFFRRLLQLRDHVAGGMSLAEAMRQQPQLFDDYCVAITEVGQNAGNLDVALKRLATFRLKAATFRGRIATALLYPAIVLTMALGVSIFLMTFVVPRLLEGLIQAGRPVPGVTRAVKATSDFLLHDWWLLLLVVAVLMLAVTVTLRTFRGRWAWDSFVLRVPILGEVLRKQAVGRIATIIAEMMRSGIEFLRALEIAHNTTGNLVFRDALQKCETAVTSGREIAEALADTHAFAPVVVQVFSVGQDICSCYYVCLTML